MKVTRYEAITRDLTVATRKVFDCVPVQEPWSISKICSEMIRQGLTRDRRAITGCLNSLVRDGLIRESLHEGLACFQRVAPPAAPPAAPLVLVPTTPFQGDDVSPLPPKKMNHMDRMAVLAERARAMALELKTLAEDIDAAAVLIDEEAKDAGKDTAKLRQLQTLLKELT